MKQTIFSLFIIISQLSAQPQLHQIDFYSWNNLNEKGVQYISNWNGKIIRSFHQNQFIHWEIIQKTDSTFWYLEYTDSSTQPIMNGQLLASNQYIDIDTIITFDDNTFQERIFYDTSYQLIKHGQWIEEDHLSQDLGSYEYGIKDGYWLIYNEINQRDIQAVNYQKGKEISTFQKNRALLNNRDTILAYLFDGKWGVLPEYGTNNFTLEQLNPSHQYYIFNKNGSATVTSKRRTYEVKWILDNDLNLIIGSKKYFIHYMDKDWIELKFLSNSFNQK